MKRLTQLSFFFVAAVGTSGAGFASTPILEDLQQQGVPLQLLEDGKMEAIKGQYSGVLTPEMILTLFPVRTSTGRTATVTAPKGPVRINNIVSPRVTQGISEHHVTYKQWGNKTDYSSYQYIGNAYDPQARRSIVQNNQLHFVVGDVWMADMASSAGSWKRENARPIDTHYQAVDAQTLQLKNYGFRESNWNRPISTFTW